MSACTPVRQILGLQGFGKVWDVGLAPPQRAASAPALLVQQRRARHRRAAASLHDQQPRRECLHACAAGPRVFLQGSRIEDRVLEVKASEFMVHLFESTKLP